MTILLVVFLLIALVVMWMRSGGNMGRMGRFGGRGVNNLGDRRSVYDDPNYRSSGSIAGPGATYQDAGYRPAPRPERREPSRPAYGDEEFRSGGSIGG
jgi:hypothetical protein